MRPAFYTCLFTCFIIIIICIVVAIVIASSGIAYQLSTSQSHGQSVGIGRDGRANKFTLNEQSLNPSNILFALLSCNLNGEEQVYFTLPSTSSPRATAVRDSINEHSTSSVRSGSQSSKWDFPVICTEKFPEFDDSLCLFTSTTFASGRGISLITTLSLANVFLSLPALTDPGTLAAVNNHTFSEDLDHHQKPPCKPTPLPNRGIGTLATRPLEPGSPITAHTPLLLVLSQAPELIPPPELEPIFRKAAAQLPPVSRDMLLALARNTGIEEFWIHDIIQTNLFEVEIGGMKHLAVFPETSRINHDCGPNSQYFIDASRLTHYVHAIRPIDVDEEITITYTYPIIPRVQRHASLETFRFKCTCSRCQDPDSDSRVKHIQAIEAALSDWSPRSTVVKTGKSEGVSMASDLISLYKTEKLHAMLGRAYGFAALEFSAVKDKVRAMEYADRALWYLGLMQGKNGADVRSMMDLKGDVRSHWSWGRRM